MARVTRRPDAESDVIEIEIYIAEDSVAEADRWVDRLDERLRLWATQPALGRPREELAPSLRSMPFGRYVVFFAATQDGIDIVRVLHSSRDVDANFA